MADRDDRNDREGRDRRDAEAAFGGLCPGCAHAHLVRSERDSLFLRCRLATAEPTRPKYPPQPVLVCSGRSG